MSLLGYARVSTAEQSTQAQVDALNAAGAQRVFADTASGQRADRPALADLLAAAQEGDTVVVARLDRLGRSLPELLRLVEDLAGRGVALRSLGSRSTPAPPPAAWCCMCSARWPSSSAL